MLTGGDNESSPDQATDPHSAPGVDPADPVVMMIAAVIAAGEGASWVDYGTLDPQNGDRPNGFTACLDKIKKLPRPIPQKVVGIQVGEGEV
ncbi:hypothetical protein [Streptomyces sp. NPDC059071]|uniref:hypothetical protein n=1 Tax=unclassified Streptomyces TaxID=2593676 RepID=UPI003660BB7C